tara:strand:- start:1210 stop:1821 length:612 start_codon:yes stop_codon:yes gene_type:complete
MVDSVDYLKYTILIFLVSFLVQYSNISVRGLIGIFFGLIIISLIIYNNFYNETKEKNYITQIKKKIPLLNDINDINILEFYYKNYYLSKNDQNNFKKSIDNIVIFLNLYQELKKSSFLINYKYEVLEKYMYLTIKYFSNIQLNIYLNKESLNLFSNEIIKLENILDKYILDIKKYINKYSNYNIFYKNNIHDSIIPYNKLNYH